MRRIKLVSLIMVGCLLFTACKQSGNGEEQAKKPKEEQNAEGMVWFPKSAKATTEDGTVMASIETELKDGKLLYKYIMNYPDQNRQSYYGFEIEYADDEVTKYYELRGNVFSDREDVRKTEKVVEYDENDNVLFVNDINSENGKIGYSREHRYSFDSEGKVVEIAKTYVEYNYNEDGEFLGGSGDDEIDLYKFEYVEDGYYISYDYQPWDMILVSGEEVECVKREKTFIPYDKTKGHNKVITYHLANGELATLAKDEWYDVYCDNSQKTEFVYNNKGYLTEVYSYLADGSKVAQDLLWECEFNDVNNVKNYTEYDEDGNLVAKGEITYDDNENISNIVMEIDGQKCNVEIEWMQVPSCLDEVNQFIYGHDKYAISELIEDIIPETDVIDLQNTYYTKEMLEELK